MSFVPFMGNNWRTRSQFDSSGWLHYVFSRNVVKQFGHSVDVNTLYFGSNFIDVIHLELSFSALLINQ